jgi:hypothetical protein
VKISSQFGARLGSFVSSLPACAAGRKTRPLRHGLAGGIRAEQSDDLFSAACQSLRSMRLIRCNLMNLEVFQQTLCCYQPKELAVGDYVKIDKILLSD